MEMASTGMAGESLERPWVREATALEIFNIPLFEIPPMLDVRALEQFGRSHIVCAVPVPAEDGPDALRLFQRILDHDHEWGWLLQFPVVVIYDEQTRERASWLVGALRSVIQVRAGLDGFEGADCAERLLRRLAFQCREILLLKHAEFAETFRCCCLDGLDWKGSSWFDRFGPLPRCALLRPRIYIAGRQVQLTQELLMTLGVTHAVVNADAWDAMDGTSGGGGTQPPTSGRAVDVPGVHYLKCGVPEWEDDADVPHVLDGAARFLSACDAEGGVGLVRMHGQSCSLTVVCAFLVVARGLTVETSWQIIRKACIRADERLVWWGPLRKLMPWAHAITNCSSAE